MYFALYFFAVSLTIKEVASFTAIALFLAFFSMSSAINANSLFPEIKPLLVTISTLSASQSKPAASS